MDQPPGQRQLDLFSDSAGIITANELIEALLHRSAPQAAASLGKLYAAEPDYPGLSKLHALCQALQDWPYPASSAKDIDDTARWLEEIVEPAARTVMPRSLREFMRPFWLDLAESPMAAAYDAEHPRACAAGLYLRADEPAKALEITAGLEDWLNLPEVLAWRIQALYRLRRADACRPALFRYALLAPASFPELLALLDDNVLNQRWSAFRSCGLWLDQPQQSVAEWFPVWHGLRHSDIPLDDVPIPKPLSRAGQALELVVRLLELEKEGLSPALLAERTQLRETDRDSFELYMELRGG
ncbi:MAG: hypothetical protein FIA97_16990 [Methylococcaceae bacterium]|nr:hypothetical protein [Methylococcaceae bacterium]